jgi:hypothetical protein
MIKGFGGADAMSGGEADDQLSDGDGNNRLYGGTGQDSPEGKRTTMFWSVEMVSIGPTAARGMTR